MNQQIQHLNSQDFVFLGTIGRWYHARVAVPWPKSPISKRRAAGLLCWIHAIVVGFTWVSNVKAFHSLYPDTVILFVICKLQTHQLSPAQHSCHGSFSCGLRIWPSQAHGNWMHEQCSKRVSHALLVILRSRSIKETVFEHCSFLFTHVLFLTYIVQAPPFAQCCHTLIED